MYQEVFDVYHAHTLSADEVCDNHDSQTGLSSRTHGDQWSISGVIKEDRFYWVNDFEASHPVFGRVWGNFEATVFADSKKAYLAFRAAHSPQAWYYEDI